VSKLIDPGQQRIRRAFLSTLASAAARGTVVLTSLLSVPLTLGYLGKERFGLWMVISSLVALLGLADLGVGNGLLNVLAKAYGKDDRDAARVGVSSAAFMLLGFSLVLGLGLALAYPVVSWKTLLGVSSPVACAEAGPACAVFLACFLAGLPMSVVQQTYAGYQEGYLFSLFNAAGNLLGLAGVLVSVSLKAGLPYLVLSMAGAPVLATLVAGAYLFWFRRPWLRPSWRWIESPAARRLLKTGLLFFLLQLTAVATFSLDNFLAARFLGAGAVSELAVAFKLFSVLNAGAALALNPLWPAYGEARARGDAVWVAKTLRRSLALTALTSLAGAGLLAVGGGWLVKVWAGAAVVPSLDLRLALACWTPLNACGMAVAMYLNGINRIRFQVLAGLATGVVALGLKCLWVSSWGVAGLIWATVFAYLAFAAVPLAFYVPRTFGRPGSNSEEGDLVEVARQS